MLETFGFMPSIFSTFQLIKFLSIVNEVVDSGGVIYTDPFNKIFLEKLLFKLKRGLHQITFSYQELLN